MDVDIKLSVEGGAGSDDEEDCVMKTPSKKVKVEGGMDFERISGMMEKFGGARDEDVGNLGGYHEDVV